MALTDILSVGLDPELLGTRNLVLQSAGYTVVSANSIKEALDRFRAGDFDLVLLCQSIPRNERDRLSLWIRASGSRTPVVSISGKLCERDGFANATVPSDPAALLWGIRKVLINTAMHAARTVTPRDRQGVAATQGKKQPIPSVGNEQQAENTNRRHVPLGRAG